MERTLIVGLGNPGRQYKNTRHNIGFLVIDSLASELGIECTKTKFNAEYGQGTLGSAHPVTLLKPQTFMNLSGKSVAPCARFFQIPAQRIIVIHDELDLAYGTIRVKSGGGHAGHNGLRSIIEMLGSREFMRLRIGIGRPQKGSVSEYVLSNFNQDEVPWLEDLRRLATQDLSLVIKEGIRSAMNQIHSRPKLL